MVFLCVFALVLLFFGQAETFVGGWAQRLATDAAAPVLEAARRGTAMVRSAADRAGEYAAVIDDNRRLQAENASLRVWRDRALALESRIARYEALLNVELEPDIGYVTARVIGESGGPFVNTAIAGAGRQAGVEDGSAVIDGRGLVGRVVSSGARASRLLLITDLNSRIPVAVGPGRHRAILAGDNSAWPVLEHLPAGTPVAAGDRVVTSGDGGLLPPDLPVGVVSARSGDAPQVQVAAGFDRLDLVRILDYRSGPAAALP